LHWQPATSARKMAALKVVLDFNKAKLGKASWRG
jgi:hypothetical protein